MFYPLDRQLTEDQLPNTKYQLKFLLWFLLKKRRGLPGLISFGKQTVIITSADIWYLVIGYQSPVYPMERTLRMKFATNTYVKFLKNNFICNVHFALGQFQYLLFDVTLVPGKSVILGSHSYITKALFSLTPTF